MFKQVFLGVVLLTGMSMHRSDAQRFLLTGVPDAEVLSFFQKFQRAVGVGDRQAVAGMVNYPVRINRGPARHQVIEGRADFIRQYESIFTPAIRQAIVSDKPADLFADKQGVAIGRGLVWLKGSCSHARPPVCHIGLASVNLPEEPRKP